VSDITMRSVRLQTRPDVIVTVHHPSFPPNSRDWTQHAQVCDETINDTGMGVTLCYSLVFTDGPGPNAMQRKEVADIVRAGKLQTRSAAVSSSMLVRGIVTATSWLGVPVRAFNPTDWHAAFAFAGLTSDADIREARLALLALAAQIGAQPRSLDVIAKLAA
jgi:hypothetical protein